MKKNNTFLSDTRVEIEEPFYHLVPKTVRENLLYRQAIAKHLMKHPSAIGGLREACRLDMLFYVNTFVWTFDPRRPWLKKIPFVTYDYQDEAIRSILDVTRNGGDLLIKKSRDMGASWLCLMVYEWLWHFYSYNSFLIVARTAEGVDKPGDSKSLFWKVDFLHKHQPKWLMPAGFIKKKHRLSNHFENPENGSVIDGEATTTNVARGDRRTSILLDEFAGVPNGFHVLSSTRDATNSRIFNSTPQGTANAYYAMTLRPITQLRFHWTQHPLKNKGLYKSTEGELQLVDKEYEHEVDYEFVLDDRIRSPWYDLQCERAASLQEIAQELDIDFLGSGHQFFKAKIIEEVVQKYARSPLLTGDLEYERETGLPLEWRQNVNGRLSLWINLDGAGKPIIGNNQYVIGCDAAAGTGASNSVASIWHKVTKEKVGSYVNPMISPESFAGQAVALCRWLGNAFLIWETQGTGRQFGDRVIALDYLNCYFRRPEDQVSKKASDIPGWYPSKDNKLSLLGNYRQALETDNCLNRDELSLRESMEYMFTGDGSVEHVSTVVNREDPSGAKSQHGDRVIADALSWHVIKGERSQVIETVVPVSCASLAGRRQKRERSIRQSGSIFQFK